MFNTIILSDIHYGNKNFIFYYLKNLFETIGKSERCILDGDILDSWVTDKWDMNIFNELFYKYIEKDIIIVKGNHDPENLNEYFSDKKYTVVKDYEINLNDKKYKIIHGHEYDDSLRKYKLFSRICFYICQFIYKRTGWDLQKISHFSPSKMNKSPYFKNIIFSMIEKMKIDYSKEYNGIITGHTHYPIHTLCDGFEYINTGDFVEHYSYLIIQDDKMFLNGFYPYLKRN